ncbi:MAG TPA: ABC transporter permease, partial [Methylomirabilota bacterium]|nr:ABC transporter permease [Methylomirabilota bacterium]
MRLAPLHLKLLRDLSRLKGQTLAVSLVMACGLAMMIMARSLIFSLESTRDRYYEEHRFADVFADLKRAPNLLRPRLAEIPDVAAVETRVTGRLTLDLPGQLEPADGVILSLPDDRPQQLHKLFLRRGRTPEPGRRGEVIVGEAFATVHGLGPGDTVSVLLRGQRETLTIVGVALSPEYVFEARPGETLPDNKRFGVFWMNERELATALDLDGAFNNVIVDVAPGGDTLAVMAELDRRLANYGAVGAISRRDHPSAVRLNDELTVLRTLAFAFPIVFLSIAAFMTSAVLSRLVRLQREQIAQLKAFGYSGRQVGLHYFQFALVIVTLGTIFGVAGGFWLGDKVVNIYHRFFKFPSLEFHPDYSAIFTAFAISAVSSFAGVFNSVRLAMRLPPAEAMRPEPPASYRASLAERLGLARRLSPTVRMALRNLERRPWQAFFTAFGLALAAGIPVVPCTFREGVDYLLGFQWDTAQRQNVTVSLFEPASASAVGDLLHLPGVLFGETFRSVPARLRHGHASRKLTVTGLPRDARLHRVLDAREQPIPLPPDGLLVSAKLAEILGAKPGDTVMLEVQEGRRPQLETVIRGLITDYAGVFAYMDKEALHRLMR